MKTLLFPVAVCGVIALALPAQDSKPCAGGGARWKPDHARSQPRQHAVRGNRQEGRFVTDLGRGDFDIGRTRSPKRSSSSLRKRPAIAAGDPGRYHQQRARSLPVPTGSRDGFIDSVIRKGRQGDGGELRHRHRTRGGPNRRHPGSRRRCRVCAPEGAPRYTTPCTSPVERSRCRISPCTNSAAPW